MSNTSEIDVTLFARTNFRHDRRIFGIRRADGRAHMYIIGKTRVGKSTLVEALIGKDMEAGEALALLDPWGIKLRRVMDDSKIPLVNLAKGKIGEDPAALLGAMLVSRISMAALCRANVPEDNRRDFYLYLDELAIPRGLATGTPYSSMGGWGRARLRRVVIVPGRFTIILCFQ